MCAVFYHHGPKPRISFFIEQTHILGLCFSQRFPSFPRKTLYCYCFQCSLIIDYFIIFAVPGFDCLLKKLIFLTWRTSFYLFSFKKTLLWEVEAGGSRGQEIETILVNKVKPHLYWKYKKISWAWWRVPVIPATQEAEAGELAEPRRRRLRWAEIAPLHSSLGNKSETPSQKKKEKLLV